MNLLEKLDFKRRIDEAVEQKGRSQLLPGDKVRLNYKKIRKDPNYKRKRMDWKMFVGKHQNDVFTVEYDPKFGPSPSVVCFAEDRHEPKWIWPVNDLIHCDTNTAEKV